MKRNILYLIFGLFLLASCRQEELSNAGTGYLAIADLSVEAPQVNVVSSRVEAEEEPLTIEIVNEEGTTVQKFTETELTDRIELAVGKYTLKVYSENYGTDAGWTNTEKGEAIYYAEKPFEVTVGQTATVSIGVPMINFGVTFHFPEAYKEYFTYTFTVTEGGRTVELQDGETAYFPYTAETTSFAYVLNATNIDGESLKDEETYGGTEEGESVAPGTIYAVTYELETQSFSITR